MTDDTGPARPQEFVSRQRELAVVQRPLRSASAGQDGALVVRGQAGIGKTELLEHARRSAPQLRLVRAVGREFEAELPFTALQNLCRPILAGLESLPDPQRTALEIVFALRDGTAPDRFRTGLAGAGPARRGSAPAAARLRRR
jgi:hypothetical protein